MMGRSDGCGRSAKAGAQLEDIAALAVHSLTRDSSKIQNINMSAEACRCGSIGERCAPIYDCTTSCGPDETPFELILDERGGSYAPW